MKKYILTLVIGLMTISGCYSHYMWIETNTTGMAGKTQQVKVFFGEYTYGVIEKVNGDAFTMMKNFTLQLVHPDGTISQIQTSPGEDHYQGTFTPSTPGTYSLILNNNNIDVIDYTQYDFGIFKTHYHATATVQVGSQENVSIPTNSDGLSVVPVSQTNDKVTLKVFYKGMALSKSEVAIYVADLWSKKMETDENGTFSFALPWQTKYLIEITLKEEVPGTFNGKDYQFIWHCATYCIQN